MVNKQMDGMGEIPEAENGSDDSSDMDIDNMNGKKMTRAEWIMS
jgi:hypothetical protein